LEFLRYPHLIRRLFNGGRFGPPWSFTSTSAWTWIGHPVSGHKHATLRPIQTRSRFGSTPEVLNLAAYLYSPDHSTKGTISHLDVLYVLVSTEFQVLFHSPPGVLFTFPSQYYTLSVTREYLGLEGGPPIFPRDFTCPAVLWIPLAIFVFRIRNSHALRWAFPYPSARLQCAKCGPKPRPYCYERFGLFRFRSPLLSESRLISLPRPT
jgi:hypothetical protein